MIETIIKFKCTWTKEKVQKLFDSLIKTDGITELGLSMIFLSDTQACTEEPVPAEIHTPEPKHIETEPLEPIDVPWPVKETPSEPLSDNHLTPYVFAEIERIPRAEIGPVINTSKPILTYAETKDGRVAIFYNGAPMYTTMSTIRALPKKISPDMVRNLSSGKRAALRGFKKWITEIDSLENDSSPKYDTSIDPYAPILTGGAKVDTHASGKVEGDLE